MLKFQNNHVEVRSNIARQYNPNDAIIRACCMASPFTRFTFCEQRSRADRTACAGARTTFFEPGPWEGCDDRNDNATVRGTGSATGRRSRAMREQGKTAMTPRAVYKDGGMVGRPRWNSFWCVICGAVGVGVGVALLRCCHTAVRSAARRQTWRQRVVVFCDWYHAVTTRSTLRYTPVWRGWL